MRGLDTRVTFAVGTLTMLTSPEVGESMVKCAAANAEADGYREYRAGCRTVPPMYSDVPDLALNWELGQAEAARFEAYFPFHF